MPRAAVLAGAVLALGAGAGPARAGNGGMPFPAPEAPVADAPGPDTAPGPPDAPGPLSASTPRRAYVQGDSLAAGIELRLPALLAGWRFKQSHATGRTLREGVRRIAWRNRRPDGLDPVLIVSLGTNDSPSDPDGFRRRVRELMDLVGGGRCVVWANVVRPRVGKATYARLNAVLADEARRRANLVLVDWVAMTRVHRNWVRRDGVHATAAGYAARAKAFAAGVRWCVGENPGWWRRYLLA